ncbi:MAG: division/cell wall cluster transcriptional repressor MraZ [Rhodospirillales bacterium]|jgi:MraZ protein
MAALIGRHINKIDKKGRVSVPKPFRDALSVPNSAKSEFSGIYVYRSFKFPAIEGCGEAFIQRVIDSLDDLELFSDEQDDLATTILENSHQLAYDTEGRVLLPKALIDYAGLGAEAVFVGRGTRFQIWEAGAYETHNAEAFERARSRGATLRLRSSDGSKAEGAS